MVNCIGVDRHTAVVPKTRDSGEPGGQELWGLLRRPRGGGSCCMVGVVWGCEACVGGSLSMLVMEREEFSAVKDDKERRSCDSQKTCLILRRNYSCPVCESL